MAPARKSFLIGLMSTNLIFVAGWISSWFGELTCIHSSKIPIIAQDGPAFAMLETEAGIWAVAVGIGSHLESEFSLAEFRPNSKRSSPSWYTPTDNDPFGGSLPDPTVSNLILGTYGYSFDRQVSLVLPFWIVVAPTSVGMLWLWITRKQPAEQASNGKPDHVPS